MQNPQSNEQNLQKVTKFQKFETVTIHRSQIKNAPYNPRFIDKHARVKLKNKIDKDGLVEALTWNEKTGNLVSGHQRISILDELNETQDYYLTVCKINVSDKKEKELNVFLNNSTAQGAYDFDLLKNMMADETVSVEEFGFDDLTVNEITGKDSTEAFFDTPVVKATVEQIQKINDAKKAMKEAGNKRDDVNYYLTVVFQDATTVDAFLDKLKLPKTERYVDGNLLIDFMGGL